MDCPKCGAPCETGDKFCAECSSPLPQATGDAAAQPQAQAPPQASSAPAPAAPKAASSGGNFALFKVPGSTTSAAQPAQHPTTPQAAGHGMALFQAPSGVAEPPVVGIPRNCDCGAGPDKIGLDRICKDCGNSAIIPIRDDFYVKVDGDANRMAVRSNIGKRHWRNEDYAKMLSETINGVRYTWIVLSDGVSSSQNPDQASEQACKAGSDAVRKSLKSSANVRAALDSAVAAAQKAVTDVPYDHNNEKLPGPQGTLVVCIIHDNVAELAWIADSRAYVFRKDAEGKLSGRAETKDQSWCNVQVDSGAMTMEEALKSPQAHVIVQSLGELEPGFQLEPGYNTVSLDGAVAVLVCSDGFYQYCNPDPALPPEKMLEMFSQHEKDALGFTNACIVFANASGGGDNITVCVALLPVAA